MNNRAKQFANKKNFDAQHDCHQNDKGTNKNEKKAFEWYLKSAER